MARKIPSWVFANITERDAFGTAQGVVEGDLGFVRSTTVLYYFNGVSWTPVDPAVTAGQAFLNGATPPTTPHADDSEFDTVGLLSAQGWDVESDTGETAAFIVQPRVLTPELGMEFAWDMSVVSATNRCVTISRDAPTGDFGIYARLGGTHPDVTNWFNHWGIFAGKMTGTVVDEALFAGLSVGYPIFRGGKTFTSTSQISGTFRVCEYPPGMMWVRLRYVDSENRSYAAFSNDGRVWSEVRTDEIFPESPNKIGLAMLSNTLGAGRVLYGRCKAFRVVEGTIDPNAPVPSADFE